MGSVLYLHRGLQRKEAPVTAASQRPESLLRPGYNCLRGRARRARRAADRRGGLLQGVPRRGAARAALDHDSRAGISTARRACTSTRWPKGGPPALLGDFLNYLVRRRRGLHVNVLNWDYPMVFGADREFPPLYGFGWKPARRVHLRYDDTHPVAGSPAPEDRGDRRRGRLRRRHRPHGAALGLRASTRPTIRAASPTASPTRRSTTSWWRSTARPRARSRGIARERWRLATGRSAEASRRPTSDPWPRALEAELRDVEVGIARTMPPRGDAPAVREVERLYLDMIAAAQRDDLHREPVLHLAAHRRRAGEAPGGARRARDRAGAAAAEPRLARGSDDARAAHAPDPAPAERRPPRPLPRVLPAHPRAWPRAAASTCTRS